MEPPAPHSHHPATLPIQAAEPEAPAAGGEVPGWSWRRTSYPWSLGQRAKTQASNRKTEKETRLGWTGGEDGQMQRK